MKNVTIYYDVDLSIIQKRKDVMHKICNVCGQKKSAHLFLKQRRLCVSCNNLKRNTAYKQSQCRQCLCFFRPGTRGRYKFCSEICRFNSKIVKDEKTGCWLWQANKDACGYGKFTPLGGKNSLAHRSSYRLFKGPIKENMLVLHKCHVPSCVNPAHLKLGTHADNMHDKIIARRCNTRPGNSKLTEQQVLEIQRSPLKQKELALLYNVHIETISHIKRGITWKHLQGENYAIK